MEKDAEILSIGKIAESSRFAERKRLKSQDRSVLHILAEGGDIVDGRILDFIQECSVSGTDVERQDSVFLMPIRASLLTACPAEVLTGRFNVCGRSSESLRICLQSS